MKKTLVDLIKENKKEYIPGLFEKEVIVKSNTSNKSQTIKKMAQK